MIDFRYHLVSIVAVFLALAIGIVLGSTELQGNTIDVLRTSSNQLKNEYDQVNAERETAQAEVGTYQTFLTTAEPRLLANELPGDRIVLVTEPGASSTVISGVKQAAADAGATVTGQVAIQPKFNDLSGTTESSLNQINSDLATADSTSLATPTNEQTLAQQQAAQLIGTAILATTTAGETTGLSTADATTLLGAYAQAGYITITPAVTNRATLAVIVTPDTAPADGQNDPGTQVLLAMAQEFAGESAATAVVGSTAGSSPSRHCAPAASPAWCRPWTTPTRSSGRSRQFGHLRSNCAGRSRIATVFRRVRPRSARYRCLCRASRRRPPSRRPLRRR